MAVETPAPLAPQDAARLTEFARAFKAAARAVVLYPAAHPAIGATLGRIVSLTDATNLAEPLRIGVLADGLVVDGRAPARVDPAIIELATLLHDHLIGELTIHPGGDLDAWRAFLLLLGRAPDAVRAEGGIARLWTTMAGRHVEIREIDYAEVLRERKGGEAAAWDQVIANCLQGDAFELNEETIRALLDAAADSEKLAQLMATLDARAAETGRTVAQRTTALLRLLQGIVQAVSEREPERVEPMLRNLAGAAGRLSPDMLVSLLSQRDRPAAPPGSTPPEAAKADVASIVTSVTTRMSDATIAQFVAKNALTPGTSIDRVAQAFHALVQDVDRRERLITMAHDEAAASPFGAAEGFEKTWETVAEKMITSYSDEPFVSDEYARELSTTRSKAIDIEQLNDDPPERLAAWLGTVATTELRNLDLTLVLDLLRIEADTERWATLMRPVVALIEDLLLVGDFDAAGELVRGAARPHGRRRRRGAPAEGARRARRAGERLDDAAHRGASRDRRRGAVRAHQGDVRLARRNHHPAARRGAGGRRAGPAAGTPHVDPDCVRGQRPARSRAPQELAERGRAPHGDLPASRVRRQRSAPRAHWAAERQRAAGAARGGPRDLADRHRIRLPGAREGAPHRHRPVARDDHAGVDPRSATIGRHRSSRTSSITSTIAGSSARSTCAPSKRSGRRGIQKACRP